MLARLDSRIAEIDRQIAEIDREIAVLEGRADEFNPDQPRDPDGKFASTGSSGGGGSSKEPRATSKSLPDNPRRYFKTTSATKMVPVSKLKTIRARSSGIENASKHMANAYNNEGDKRGPIDVSENPDGTFTVEDGNSTTAIAREHNWKELPVNIVPKGGHKAEKPHESKAAEKERKTQQALTEIERLRNEGKLPKDITPEQHREIAQKFLDDHKQNLPEAMDRLSKTIGHKVEGRTKDLDSALGKLARKPKYGTTDKLGDGTGMRATVSSIDETRAAVAAIEKNYEVTDRTDYLEKGNDGYRAYHLNIKDKDGLIKEIQIQTTRQRAFQKWSHDVYKPQTEAQSKLLQERKADIVSYGQKVSDHYYAKDLGRESTMPAPPDDEVVKVFGAPNDI